jgi:S-DNA-T family DNA segregation ATPase FtsK/SpoIIIE
MHLHDPHDASILGTTASAVPPAIAGRVHLVDSGLTAQLVHPRNALTPLRYPSLSPPEPIVEVPQRIEARDLHATQHLHAGAHPDGLLVGVSLRTGRTHAIELPPGDHFAVLGPARSGRTTALARLVAAWRAQHSNGSVSVVTPRLARHSGADQLLRSHAHAPGEFERATGPRLLVVDDAELVDDTNGMLATLAGGCDGRTSVVIAGRPDALRPMYGHWSAIVRRSRTGLVAAGGNDLDGDLLGSMLPRRTVVPARPGLMWCVANGEHDLVQVAIDAQPDTSPDDNRAAGGSRLAPR